MTSPTGLSEAVLAGPLIDGQTIAGQGSPFTLTDPFRRETIGSIGAAGPVDVADAIRVAGRGLQDLANLAAHQRAEILERAADLLQRDQDAIAREITQQVGKAIRECRREVDRSAATLRASASAARQPSGTFLRADASQGGEGLLAFEIRVPIGIAAAIVPFNSPLNLTAHKIGPAVAAGVPVILKPSSAAPLTALRLARALFDAGLPCSAVSILPGPGSIGEFLVADPAIKFVTFTGGTSAGAAVAKAAGWQKRITLELGGNSATIIHRDADLAAAARWLVWGAFGNAGQSCNSAQRILIHKSAFDQFVEAYVPAVAALKTGDPLDDATDVGAMVNEDAAARVEGLVRAAARTGATVLTGGTRQGAVHEPTVVTGTPPTNDLACTEAFGPVVLVDPYDDLDEALRVANSTPFGLVGAVFTQSTAVVHHVARTMEVGVVNVNRPPNYRLDHLPYGGVKQSGVGREGPSWAMEEMTERRLVLIDPGDPQP